MKSKLICGVVIGLCLASSLAWADSLELKNGSLIKGRFMGGTESEISFQVGSSVQQYNLADIVSLRFDSGNATSDMPVRPNSAPSSQVGMAEQPGATATAYATVPAGTHIMCAPSMASIPRRTTWGIASRLRWRSR